MRYAFCLWMPRDNDIPSVKMIRPELSVTAVSDSLLVEWKILSPISEHLYHCQLKHSMVCQCVCLSLVKHMVQCLWAGNV